MRENPSSRISLTQSVPAQAKRPRAGVFPRRHPWIALGTLLTIALVVGCARQYHWYRCGCDCVDYNYCPPAPLPYTPYCTCPTPIAESYQHQVSTGQNPVAKWPPEGAQEQ